MGEAEDRTSGAGHVQHARQLRGWLGALGAMSLAAVFIVLDLSDRSFDQWFDHHGFTTNIISTLLGLGIGALVIDRIAERRQLRDRSRVMASQSVIIVGQAARATEAVRAALSAQGERDAASDELRTLATLLMMGSAVLLQAHRTRRLLEDCNRLAALLASALGVSAVMQIEATAERIDAALEQVRASAQPIIATLSTEQRQAVPGDSDVGDSAGAASSRRDDLAGSVDRETSTRRSDPPPGTG